MRDRLRDPAVAHHRRWLTLLVLCVSLMVIGLDNTILNVALPTLAKPKALGGLGASSSQLQWIVDSYTIVFAGLLLTAGSLGDRFGRYKALTLGLVIFGIGSVVSSFAGSVSTLIATHAHMDISGASTLIATRALMGIGGAFIMPSTLSILTNVFRDRRERAKAIGIWAGVSALGIGFGPVAGGTLLSHFWWGSVFLVNAPVVVLGLILGFGLVPESRDPEAPRLDPLGAVLSIAGLGSLLWAIIEGPSKGWSSLEILVAFGAAVVVLGGFLAWELKCSSPMLDIRFFKNPRFSAASGAVTLTFFALFGTLFLLTQYLQSVLGYGTVKAGAVLLPQAGVLMLTAPTSTRWVHKFGNKLVVAAGLLIVGAALALFVTLTPSSSTLHVILVTMVLALGMGNVMAPATESIMGSLPPAKAGVGSAMNDTTRQVGGAVGVAVLGSVLSSKYGPAVTAALKGKAPKAVVDVASNSIGAVRSLAASTQARPFAKPLMKLASDSFVSGMHIAAVVGATVIVLAAVGVLIWLPARPRDEQPQQPSKPSTSRSRKGLSREAVRADAARRANGGRRDVVTTGRR